jgi:PAS domain S-box-containing protein
MSEFFETPNSSPDLDRVCENPERSVYLIEPVQPDALRAASMPASIWRYIQHQGATAMRTTADEVQSTSSMGIGKAAPRSKLETSIPDSAASLESILLTGELFKRPSRPPDYESENSALAALVSALIGSPQSVLQTLADQVLGLLHAGSAGISLLTKDENRFYWAAIAGAWRPLIGGGTPRDFGPCGDVIDFNIPMLFSHWERRYPYLSTVIPPADEGLLIPFYVSGKAVGTIWAIAHNNDRKFDSEDLRLLESMGRFASAAHHAAERIESLERAEAALRERTSGLEARLRRLVDSNIMGIIIWRYDGQILDANETFLSLVGYDRNDLESGRLNCRHLTPAEWHSADEGRLEELAATGTAQPYEKEYLHKNGHRVPVIVGGAVFQDAGNKGIGFVVDVTDRKRAEAAARESEDRCREAQMELAHANRVTTLGQLSASIAHEVSQPIAAAVNNASAALRWLDKEPRDVDKARRALGRIIANGSRATEVIGRMRALLKKAPLRKEDVEINKAILEVVGLTRSEAAKNGISVQTQLVEALPVIQGDRVQLQQVILNLIMNAVEAMNSVAGGPRELMISTGGGPSEDVLIAVRDSGPGLPPVSRERVFDAFYTTKPGGLGMGLSICRSIIEAHGGRLWANANMPRGATFQFTLPAHAAISTENAS